MSINKINSTDKTHSINEVLENISRGRLNRLVQAELFSYDYKNFSSFIKNLGNSNLTYGMIMNHIQKGLYGDSGSSLKRYKNVPNYYSDTKPITKYMSPLELIRYREALENVKNGLTQYRQNSNASYYSFYKKTESIADDVYREFEQTYPHDFVSTSGKTIEDCILKSFNKGLKLGLHKKMLTSATLEPETKLTLDSTPYFDPYLDFFFDQYEYYRKMFVSVVKALDRNGFDANKIKRIFTAYEKIFFNTSYLKDNNISVIDYTLGFGKDSYFIYDELDPFQTLLYELKKNIEMMENYCEYKRDLSDEEKYKFIYNTACSSAKKSRDSFIKSNADEDFLYKRPESTSVFLVACLEKIMHEKDPNFRPSSFDIPESFMIKAVQVSKSIKQKRAEKTIEDANNADKLVNPSFFDLGYIQEP